MCSSPSHSITTVLLTVAAYLLSAVAQECPGSSVPFVTQTSLESEYDSCTSVEGDLVLGLADCSAPCTITSLAALERLQAISGSLVIQCCSALEDVSGLSSLTNIAGTLKIYYNERLHTVGGFEVLETVGNLEISQNANLTKIVGLSSLETIGGYLQIDHNQQLVELDGLSGVGAIGGSEVVAGHALNVLYNTALRDLRWLQNLTSIRFGTVHIEGNLVLCYAGYPQWSVGGFNSRPPSGDRGIDWRTLLAAGGVPSWQYSWNTEGSGYPTLVIQNNAPYDFCDAAECHASCKEGAGCLGPLDAGLCGMCLEGYCEIGATPTLASCAPTPIPYWPPTRMPYSLLFGILFAFCGLLLLGLVVLGGWVMYRMCRRLRAGRKGSFDVHEGLEMGVRRREEVVSSSSHDQSSIIAQSSLTTERERGGHGRSGGGNVVLTSSSYRTTSSSHQPPPSTNVPPLSSIPPTITTSPPPTITITPVTTDTNFTTSTAVTTTPQHSGIQGALHSIAEEAEEIEGEGGREREREKGRKGEGENRREGEKEKGRDGEGEVERGGEGEERRQEKVDSAAEKKPVRRLYKQDTLTRLQKGESVHVPMNFPRSQLKMKKEIGKGDFGTVFFAEAKMLISGEKKTPVIVKQLKENSSKQEQENFLRPVEAMGLIQHANVMSLLGACVDREPIMILMEYCSQGNLKTYLVRKRREMATFRESGKLLTIACDMAAGLTYLHSQSIAHNDFAVRNCLVSSDESIKLGDYGLTQHIFKEDYYSRGGRQKAWPVRWMAPEQMMVKGKTVLDSHPTTITGNVWSFGVSLWEVCTFAQWPYFDLSNEEVIDMVQSSWRCALENPFQSSDTLSPLYDVMQQCWQPVEARATMADILARLEEIRGETARNTPSSMRKRKKSASPKTTPKTTPTTPPSKPAANTTRPDTGMAAAAVAGGKKSGGRKPRRPAPKVPEEGSLKRGTTLQSRDESEAQHNQHPLEKAHRARSVETRPNKHGLTASGMIKANPLVVEAELKRRRDVGGVTREKGGARVNEEEDDKEGLLLVNRMAEGEAERESEGVSEKRREGEMFVEADEDGLEEDFILEPPEDFSQHSIGHDDETGFTSPANTNTYKPHGPSKSRFTASDDFGGFEQPSLPELSAEERRASSSLPAAQTHPETHHVHMAAEDTLDGWNEPDFDDVDLDSQYRQPTSRVTALLKRAPSWGRSEREGGAGGGDDDIPNVVYDDEVSALIW